MRTRNPGLGNRYLSDFGLLRGGPEKDLDQLAQSRFSSFLDFVDLDGADRMLDHQHRMIRRTEGFFLGFRQCGKRVGDEGDGKLAALLNF